MAKAKRKPNPELLKALNDASPVWKKPKRDHFLEYVEAENDGCLLFVFETDTGTKRNIRLRPGEGVLEWLAATVQEAIQYENAQVAEATAVLQKPRKKKP